VDAKVVSREIEQRLETSSDHVRAVQEKRYLKSDLEFFGTGMRPIREVVSGVMKERGPLGHENLVALVAELWHKPVHERRMAAVVLLEVNTQDLTVADLPLLERLIRESETWAFVDGLATKVLGTLTMREASVRAALDAWATDNNFWIRRSSLLAEMRWLKEGGDFAPFAARADQMLEEKEFFIRKAIGWVLREMSKSRPDEVYAWLAPRASKLSGVTMREAVKYLSADQQDRLGDAPGPTSAT
jgi:3-methyladenine DNA glycosylase AlkD